MVVVRPSRCVFQLLNERHEFDVITKWTLSLDGTVFAFSRDDGVIIYLVSPQVCLQETHCRGALSGLDTTAVVALHHRCGSIVAVMRLDRHIRSFAPCHHCSVVAIGGRWDLLGRVDSVVAVSHPSVSVFAVVCNRCHRCRWLFRARCCPLRL